MRERMLVVLVLLSAPLVPAQTGLADWKVLKDSKNACQIMVPPEWTPLGDNTGAATLQDTATAVAVVTSQPGQTFKPLPESLQKSLGIRKKDLFENSPKRVFYQDRTAAGPEDQNAYSVSVPGKGGTCSCHVAFLPSVGEEVARKIALSLGPVRD
jgi:hypothetical protein